MQSPKNPFSGFHVFEDLSKMATGTVSTIFDVKKEAEHIVKQNVEQLLGMYNLVTREEHDVVKDMAKTARVNQDSLEQRVQDLEAKLAKANTDLSKAEKPKPKAVKSAEKVATKAKPQVVAPKVKAAAPQAKAVKPAVEKVAAKKTVAKKPVAKK